MRWILAIVVFALLVSPVLSWPWDKVPVLGQSVVAVQSGTNASNFELVLRLSGAKPMTCSAVGFESAQGVALTPISNYLVAKSPPGTRNFDMRLRVYPNSQIARISCMDSCGDGVCSGNEQAGTSMNTACPADCGCGNGQVFSRNQFWINNQTGCMNECTQQGSAGYYERFCGNSVVVGAGVPSAVGCQFEADERWCSLCSPGSYAATIGSNCDRYKIGDGICRLDLGEAPSSTDCTVGCGAFGSCPTPGSWYYTCRNDPTWRAAVVIRGDDPDNPVAVWEGMNEGVYCNQQGCFTDSGICWVDTSSWPIQ